MKKIITILVAIISLQLQAQQVDYNLKKGYVAEGYDVVEYFNNNAVEGKKAYITEHDGVKYKFASADNLAAFKATPEKYTPQYGGYCAYAVADKGKKVGVDPKTFEIRDGKLYLFYNSWGVNTLEKWKEEGPEKLQGQADAAWADVKFKN